MAEFRYWNDYLRFEARCKYGPRYILDEDTQEFLSALVTTSEARRLKMPKGTLLWRSQLGSAEPIRVEWEEGVYWDTTPSPLPEERMKPRINMASEGRANPKGIPYLYLSTDRDTAMAEVRPWVGSEISVGLFQMRRDLVLVDCSRDKYTPILISELDSGKPDAAKLEQVIWGGINKAFSEPVTPTDYTPDYIPTQVIAECFRVNGIDGIQYGSALGEGHNIVLFDLDEAELAQCCLFRVSGVRFSFEQVEKVEYLTQYGKYYGFSGST